MTTQQKNKAIDRYARKHGIESRGVRASKDLTEAAKREWEQGTPRLGSAETVEEIAVIVKKWSVK